MLINHNPSFMTLTINGLIIDARSANTNSLSSSLKSVVLIHLGLNHHRFNDVLEVVLLN